VQSLELSLFPTKKGKELAVGASSHVDMVKKIRRKKSVKTPDSEGIRD